MASIGSTEKDSITTTRDSFKDCIFTRKIKHQMDTNVEKGKVSQRVSGNFAQKWLFCKTYVLYNICSFACSNFFEKHVRSSSCLAQIFFKEDLH